MSNGVYKTCSFKSCRRKVYAVSLCDTHYRQQRSGKPLTEIIQYDYENPYCYFEGCTNKRSSRGLCGSHTYQLKKGIELHPLNYNTPGEWREWYQHEDGYIKRTRCLNTIKETQVQHRVVMEDHIGRKLRPEETVHHLNGVRNDNRIENLELWSSSHPKGQRVEDKVAWAKEMLALYDK